MNEAQPSVIYRTSRRHGNSSILHRTPECPALMRSEYDPLEKSPEVFPDFENEPKCSICW